MIGSCIASSLKRHEGTALQFEEGLRGMDEAGVTYKLSEA